MLILFSQVFFKNKILICPEIYLIIGFVSALMGRLNDVSKDVRQGVMSGLRDVFIVWRRQGYPYLMEKKFTDLVRVLSRDDDLPSKTFADGIANF